MNTLRLLLFALCASLLGLQATSAVANNYPDRTIRLIVPYPPGASTDLAARMVADHMSKQLDNPVIVENRPGASGSIGTQYVLRQPGDGYTFILGTDVTHGTNSVLISDQDFDPVDDSTPLGLLASNPILLVVNAEVPANSLDEYIKGIKSGEIDGSYGSSGPGSPHHLAGELLKTYTNAPLVHIPYRGGGPAVADLLSGQIPAAFASVITVLPNIKQGLLKPLAVTDDERYIDLPDVPTIGESIKGYNVPSWLAFFGPKDISEPAKSLLIKALQNAINDPDIKDKLIESGLVVPDDTSPERLRQLQLQDFELKKKIIIESGMLKGEEEEEET